MIDAEPPAQSHPTLAIAAPCDDPELIPAWWDFDGDDAIHRAEQAAYKLAGGHKTVAFVVVHHPRGAHLLSPTLIPWGRYIRMTRWFGADEKAAEIAVERGQPFLRVSVRPYDHRVRVLVFFPRTVGAQRVELDPQQAAAVGTYLGAICPGTIAATYMQTRGAR